MSEREKALGILWDIERERQRQDELLRQGKFENTCASSNLSNAEKLAILAEEFGEVSREVSEEVITAYKTRWNGYEERTPANLEAIKEIRARDLRIIRGKMRTELVQVAAVCVAWIEGLDAELRKEEP